MIRQALAGLVDWAYGVGWWAHALTAGGSPDAFTEPGPDTAHHTPLVLLPGIWERWQYLEPLARTLHGYGHPVHFVPALGSNGAPLDASARVVADFLAERGLTEVMLVAHSKGGLIGKLAMLADEEGRISSMVTVCTPFHGSSLAPLLPLPSLRPLAAGHASLATLGEVADMNARITSVFGLFDEHVPEGSTLAGARNVRVPVAGHFRLLGHATCRQVVFDVVEGRTPAAT